MAWEHTIADFEWYAGISSRNSLSPRCPFASVKKCPRYYQSLSLMGRAGSTAIESTEDEQLKRDWEASDLWPKTAEYETSVGKSTKHDGSETFHFSHFCPEVTHDRFGVFAASLHDYADEIDRDFVQKRLGEQNVSSDDWRWRWASVQPLHYTECSLYSALVHGGPFPARPDQAVTEFKFGLFGFSVSFKIPWQKFQEWGSRLRRQWASRSQH